MPVGDKSVGKIKQNLIEKELNAQYYQQTLDNLAALTFVGLETKTPNSKNPPSLESNNEDTLQTDTATYQSAEVKIPYDRGAFFDVSKLGISRVVTETYDKHRVEFASRPVDPVNPHKIDILVNKSSIKKSTFAYWQTSGANVREATRYGILKSAALTTQAISTVGQYRLKVLQRASQKNIISNKAHAKDFILEICQDKIEGLQPLEQLLPYLNHENADQTFRKNVLNQLKEALGKYEERLVITERKITTESHAFDKAVENFKLHKNYQQDRIKEQKDKVVELKEALENASSKTAFEALSKKMENFLRTEIKTHIHELQTSNQILSYQGDTHALSRGEMNNRCEEAIHIVDKYHFDRFNPITAAHQIDYQKDKLITIRSHDHGYHNENLPDFLMVANFIENPDSKTALLESETFENKKLNSTRFTSWRNSKPSDLNLKKFFGSMLLTFLFYVIPGVFVQVASLIQHIWLGDTFMGVDLYFERLNSWLGKNPDKNSQTRLEKINDFVGKSYYSLGARLGNFIHNQILQLVVTGIVKGVKSFWNAGENLVTRLIVDFKSGLWRYGFKFYGENYSTQIDLLLTDLDTELSKINNAYRAVETFKQDSLTNIFQQKGKESFKISLLNSNEIYAHITPLWVYKSSGLINTLVDGGIGFIDVFELQIYKKHPMAGVLFTLGYAFGIGAIITPKIMTAMLTKLLAHPQWAQATIGAEQQLGSWLASGKMGQTISVGFTQAKLAAAAVNGLTQGADSWLAKGLKEIIKDPAKIIIGLGTAYGLAYGLIFGVNIPWFSDHLAHELGRLGKYNILAMTMVSLKLTVGIYELFHPGQALRVEEKKQIKASLSLAIQKAQSSFTQTENESSILNASQISQFLDATIKDMDKNREPVNPKYSENLGKTPLHEQGVQQPEDTLEQSSDDLNSNQKLNLLFKLIGAGNRLQYLPRTTKERIRDLLRDKELGFSSSAQRGIMAQLESPEKKSTVSAFFGSVLNYLVILLRIIAIPITWSIRPIYDLGRQIRSDASSTFFAVCKTTNKFFEIISCLFKVVKDIFINEGLARISSGIFKQSVITRKSYELTEFFDHKIEGLYSTTTGKIITAISAANTGPSINNIIAEEVCKKPGVLQNISSNFKGNKSASFQGSHKSASSNPPPIQQPESMLLT